MQLMSLNVTLVFLSVDTMSIAINNQQASISFPMAPERCDNEKKNNIKTEQVKRMEKNDGL